MGATATALLLAGRDQLRQFFFHPRFDVTLRHGPPDCHIIQEIRESEAPAEFFIGTSVSVSVFYSRLAVDNVGNRRARQVAVRMTRLWRDQGTGAYAEDQDFLPMNLTWAHLRETLAVPVIDAHLPRHCNLCHFYKPSDDTTTAPLMRFDTEVVPNQVGPDRWPTQKPPGRYRAEIVVTADNAEPSRRVLQIEFTGGSMMPPSSLRRACG